LYEDGGVGGRGSECKVLSSADAPQKTAAADLELAHYPPPPVPEAPAAEPPAGGLDHNGAWAAFVAAGHGASERAEEVGLVHEGYVVCHSAVSAR
jgi:hypothetical protein